MREYLATLFSSQSFKAWAGAAVALVATYKGVSADGVLDGMDIGTLVSAPLVSLGVVFSVGNRDAPVSKGD